MPLGELESLGLPGESYKLAFTPGLLAQVFQRPRAGQPPEALLPDPAAVLGGQAGNRGGYLQSQALKADGRFPASDADDHWWIPSGRSFFTADPADDAATELAQARQHFFLPRRYRDPFGQDAFVDFDAHDLLMVETRDALGNRVTVDANDYRVLQPRLVSDPNRNRAEVAFDALGMVVGTAVMGKPLPGTGGRRLARRLRRRPDASPARRILRRRRPARRRAGAAAGRHHAHRLRPRSLPPHAAGEPRRSDPVAAGLRRDARARDPRQRPAAAAGTQDPAQLLLLRRLRPRDPEEDPGRAGPLAEGGPVVNPRWVGSGWTIFNNKGKPVRQYEPFFSAHDPPASSSACTVGVSPVLFYDPAERVVATLHPNHTYEKVVFDPWQQTTYDVNDTCAPRNAQTGDPRTDPDIQRLRRASTSRPAASPRAAGRPGMRSASAAPSGPTSRQRPPSAPQPMPTRRPPRISMRWVAPS